MSRTKTFRVLLSLLLLFATLPAWARTKTKAKDLGPVISRITIRGTDIFDFETNPRLHHFPYTAINLLHIQTKEEVIRRELLFKVGDKYDPFLAQETERNLRALSFIRSARVTKFPQRDGTLALVVHVNDGWTTEPQINLGGVNKIDTTEFGFKEKNLFGYGKTVGVFYKKGDDFIQREYDYTDPRLFGSRLQLNAGYLNSTLVENRHIRIERPFYSSDTQYSYRASHEHDISTISDFEENNKVSEFEQTKETNEVAAATKVGAGRDYVNHAGLRFNKVSRNFAASANSNPARPIPVSDDLQTVFLDLDSSGNKFIETTHLEKMTRVEDINLGPSFQMSPGITPRFMNPGRSDGTQFSTSYEQRFLSQRGHLLYGKAAYSGRDTLHRAENQLYQGYLKYYYRGNDFNTFVVNSRVEWGDQLDPDTQVKLGGENGMRAFKTDSMVGTKGALLNLEDRLYFIDELWDLFSIGGAVFYDTGYVWSRHQAVDVSDLRNSVGAGLRLGLTRASNEVILRVDFSYRLHTVKADDSHFVVSFGTDQAF